MFCHDVFGVFMAFRIWWSLFAFVIGTAMEFALGVSDQRSLFSEGTQPQKIIVQRNKNLIFCFASIKKWTLPHLVAFSLHKLHRARWPAMPPYYMPFKLLTRVI